MFQLIRTDLNIDFLKISKPWVMATTIAIVLSIVGLFTKGLNLGIDFTGGAEIAVKVPADWDISRLRGALDGGGIHNATVVQLGLPQDSEFLLKLQAAPSELNNLSGKVESVLTAAMGADQMKVQKVDIVGPAAGERLKTTAFLSIIYAMIGILIYITFRFDIRFAPGIVRALLFDVVIVVGIWVLLQREFTLITVAALLTIAGYSCNDTIVIYDRIREFALKHPSWSLEQVINRSINLNLGRTFLTVICTLFVVVSLWLLGGSVLDDFAFALLIGFSVSVISTIFVANPMVLYMEKRRLAKLEQGVGRAPLPRTK